MQEYYASYMKVGQLHRDAHVICQNGTGQSCTCQLIPDQAYKLLLWSKPCQLRKQRVIPEVNKL
jgi:hypothetical protein